MTVRSSLSKVIPSKLITIAIVNLSIALIFLSIVIPGTIWDRNTTFQAIDQNEYHLHQVKIFVDKPFTWGAYPSTTSTTPGHHIVLSWASKYFANGNVGREVVPIRIANILFSLGLLLVFWWLTYLGGASNIIQTTYLVLPFLFSYQFLGSAIWIMTDNGALLWTCLTLLLVTLPTPRDREKLSLSLAGIFTALAILWRQTFAWLLIPLVVRLITSERDRKNWLLYMTTLFPPLLVLGYFLSIWHGLTPPEFIGEHVRGRINFAVLPFVASLFAVFSIFYVGYLAKNLQQIEKRKVIWTLAISIVIGLGIAILFPSSYDRAAGRWGGWLWDAAKLLPSIYDRSLLFLVLCPLGTVLIGLWCQVTARNHNKNDLLIMVGMLCWIAANMSSIRTFQRYYELLILITLTFLASRQAEPIRNSYVGPLILTGLMAAISFQQIMFD